MLVLFENVQAINFRNLLSIIQFVFYDNLEKACWESCLLMRYMGLRQNIIASTFRNASINNIGWTLFSFRKHVMSVLWILLDFCWSKILILVRWLFYWNIRIQCLNFLLITKATLSGTVFNSYSFNLIIKCTEIVTSGCKHGTECEVHKLCISMFPTEHIGSPYFLKEIALRFLKMKNSEKYVISETGHDQGSHESDFCCQKCSAYHNISVKTSSIALC